MTRWSKEMLSDFRAWHELRLDELGYSDSLKKEFRDARESFLRRVI